jgi:hypothetical protein
MCIIWELGLCGLFHSRNPMEHHARSAECAHPSLETTDLEDLKEDAKITLKLEKLSVRL